MQNKHQNQYFLELSEGKSYPYTILRSSRAKYIRLKLSNTGELTLVLPLKASIKHGQHFIQEKAAWVEKNLKKITPATDVLPKLLDLKLLNESWKVEYKKGDAGSLYLSVKSDHKDDHCLILTGDITDKVIVKKLLNKWCQIKAKNIFPQMLDSLAHEFGFHYNRLGIRSQKTRWGSCSRDKNISLNSKLLFFNENIVRYVMIHELCHTVEMNHSKKFWHLVKTYDSNYLLNQNDLKVFAENIVL